MKSLKEIIETMLERRLDKRLDSICRSVAEEQKAGTEEILEAIRRVETSVDLIATELLRRRKTRSRSSRRGRPSRKG